MKTITEGDAYRVPSLWPDPGFPHEEPFTIGIARPAAKVWPVPWLKDARLVECLACGKTGIQPRTAEAMARYIPGARLDGDRLVLATALEPVPYPDGSGRDEETVSDEMVTAASAVLAREWAEIQRAEVKREFVRRAIRAALEVLPDAHRH